VRTQSGPVLLVDAGDLLPPAVDTQGRLKGEVLARAYHMMAYDAITLGETDILYGPAYLNNLISGNELPVVSINVGAGNADTVRSAGSLNPMPPYVIKDVNGVKVAVVGMVNQRVLLPKAVTDSIGLGPMEERLEEVLPEIEARSDIIVALAHVGSVLRAKSLAGSFPELDVVVAAHVEPIEEPYYEEVGSSIVAYVRDRGRFMGRLNLLLDDENKKVIGFGHEMVPMGPSIPDDSGVLKLLTEYIDRLKILVASTAFRPTLKDLRVPPAHFVTARACRDCHEEQYAQWSETSHARAFASIEHRNRDFDPDCQECHTTGFRYVTGFITPRGTPQFKNVQCEACHGPGGDHVKAPEAHADTLGSPADTIESGPRPYGRITEKVCIRCHTRNNSPEFEYEKYLKKVVH
jgi:hypothetical protein